MALVNVIWISECSNSLAAGFFNVDDDNDDGSFISSFSPPSRLLPGHLYKSSLILVSSNS